METRTETCCRRDPVERLRNAADRIRRVIDVLQADRRPLACASDYRARGEKCPPEARCCSCDLERAINDMTLAAAEVDEG